MKNFVESLTRNKIGTGILLMMIILTFSLFYFSRADTNLTGMAVGRLDNDNTASDFSTTADSSDTDVMVWQGQYFTGTTFNTGTYEFKFDVYDAPVGGGACYSNTTTLTTGNFGEWKTEQYGVSSACNDASKSYFLEVSINREKQLPRRRLTTFEFLRKDVDETTSGHFSAESITDLNKVFARLRITSAEALAKDVLFDEAEIARNKILSDAEIATAQLTSNIDEMKSSFNNTENAILRNVTELTLLRLDIAFATAKDKITIDTNLARVKVGTTVTQAKERLASEKNTADARLEEARVLAAYKIAEMPEILEEAEKASQKIEEARALAVEKVNATAIIAAQKIENAEAAALQEITESYEQTRANLIDSGIRICLSDGTNCRDTPAQDNPTFSNVTADNGFFSYLGSLANRITKLFAQEIDVEKSIKIGYTTKGACDASTDGTIIYDEGSANQREFWGCRQKKIGEYEWVKLS